MNERILELYRQSQSNGYFGKAFDPEKFAELIIQECIGAVDIPKHLNGEAEDYFREAAQLIRNHFGVEP